MTPAVERALRALPGSIVVATVLPIVIKAGAAAILGLAAALVTMSFARNELLALLVGLLAVSAARAVGF